MTVTEVEDDTTEPIPLVDVDPAATDAQVVVGDPPSGSAEPARVRLQRTLVRVALGVLVAVLAVVGFELGVTNVWYDAHQRQLGSDFAVGRNKLRPGDAAALLQIPELGVNLTVVEGDTTDQLRVGPGHRPGTPLPGRRGNSLIFGHRHGWGAPFADLDQLHPGDAHALIVAKIRGPSPTVFKVVEVKHVAADNVRLLAPSTDYRITLVTGDGGDFSNDRLVVVAVSGTKGTLRSARGVDASADNGSPILNPSLGIAVLGFGLAWIVFGYARRRYGALATAAVVVPLLLAGGLALLLAADRVLPALR